MAPRLPQAGETEASAPRDLGLQRLLRPGCWPLRSDRPRAVSGAFLPPGKDTPLGRGPHAPRSLTPSSRPRTRGVRCKGLTCRLSTRGLQVARPPGGGWKLYGGWRSWFCNSQRPRPRCSRDRMSRCLGSCHVRSTLYPSVIECF